MIHDTRGILRQAAPEKPLPTAVILDSRTPRSLPESGARAECDGHKRMNGSHVHIAMDTRGHVLALLVRAADEQVRAMVGELMQVVQKVTGGHVELAYVVQGYTGDEIAAVAAENGIR